MTCGIPLPRCTLTIDKGTLNNNGDISEKKKRLQQSVSGTAYTAEVIGT